MWRTTFYTILARLVAITHLLIIFVNIASIPMLILLEPFYIWMPILTFMVSPVIGGTYCMFNRLENYYRMKAALPLINDRLEAFLINIKNLFHRSK